MNTMNTNVVAVLLELKEQVGTLCGKIDGVLDEQRRQVTVEVEQYQRISTLERAMSRVLGTAAGIALVVAWVVSLL